MNDIRIGISGWTYPPWRGAFYPEKLPQKQELTHASSIFRSIEINGTFYGLQKPDVFARWFDKTPSGFVFAVKAPRFITHVLRLREPYHPMANFLASGLLRLGPKLGPLLWQFPPSFRYEPDLLAPFLAMLPHDTEKAAAIAKQHDNHLKSRAWLHADAPRPIRHAMEIRHESFLVPGFVELLREHDVALVCADTVAWPRVMNLTSDFVYCRLHGSQELYRSGYDDEALDRWAARIKAWSAGHAMTDGDFIHGPVGRPKARDVYLFFDNTDKRRAPLDAQSLMRRL